MAENAPKKPTESQVREQIARGARDERNHIVRSGGRDPGQARAERVWRESIERSERAQRR